MRPGGTRLPRARRRGRRRRGAATTPARCDAGALARRTTTLPSARGRDNVDVGPTRAVQRRAQDERLDRGKSGDLRTDAPMRDGRDARLGLPLGVHRRDEPRRQRRRLARQRDGVRDPGRPAYVRLRIVDGFGLRQVGKFKRGRRRAPRRSRKTSRPACHRNATPVRCRDMRRPTPDSARESTYGAIGALIVREGAQHERRRRRAGGPSSLRREDEERRVAAAARARAIAIASRAATNVARRQRDVGKHVGRDDEPVPRNRVPRRTAVRVGSLKIARLLGREQPGTRRARAPWRPSPAEIEPSIRSRRSRRARPRRGRSGAEVDADAPRRRPGWPRRRRRARR